MSSNLTISPAGPDDRLAMQRICAHTWEWGDYIPEVWDDWLADEHGVVLIGEIEGQSVALSKITFQTPDQVWLEGMRVHPDFRRRGIAGSFLDHSLEYARAHGASVVRLGTGSGNAPVHTLVYRSGMACVGRYVLWSATPLPDANPPAVLGPQHAARVRAFLEKSRVLAHTHLLYSTGWAWEELSARRVSQMLSSGQVVAQWASDGGLSALAAIHVEPGDQVLWIGFADGHHSQLAGVQPSHISALATAIRGLAARKTLSGVPIEKVRIMLTNLAWLQESFQAAGYGPGDWDGELWIFERWMTNPQGDSHGQ